MVKCIRETQEGSKNKLSYTYASGVVRWVTALQVVFLALVYSPAAFAEAGNKFIGILPDGESVEGNLPNTTKPIDPLNKPIQRATVLPPVLDLSEELLSENAKRIWKEINKEKKSEKKKVDAKRKLEWPELLPQIVAVDAFQNNSPIEGVVHEILSFEGSNGTSEQAWVTSSVSKHLPTLSYRKKDIAQIVRPVPLLSANSRTLFHKLVGRTQKPDTGIVFGKIAPGWTLMFSGKAEKVIYLDKNPNPLKFVGSEKWNTERTFIILNAQPGGHLLHLFGPTPEQKAVVALPVFSNTSTYLHLTDVSEVTFRGTVVDASRVQMKGANEVMLYLSGKSDTPIFSEKDGSFEFSKIFCFDGMPVWIDAVKDSFFAQRYRLVPTARQAPKLYFLSEKQVQYWLEQLEGTSLDNESVTQSEISNFGMIVGSLPGVVSASKANGVLASQGLFPDVQGFEGISRFLPEVYTIGTEGRLLINTPLTEESPRFFSTQVDSGPALIRIIDQSQREIYSRLLFNSEKTINIVGPE